MFRDIVLLALLLLLMCCCTTHGSPGSALVTVLVRQKSRCEVSTLCDSYRRCFCLYYVYACALLYEPGVCGACVLSHNQLCTGKPHQQQEVRLQEPCFKLLPCASSPGVCARLVQSRISSHDDSSSTCNATVKQTWSNLLLCKTRGCCRPEPSFAGLFTMQVPRCVTHLYFSIG